MIEFYFPGLVELWLQVNLFSRSTAPPPSKAARENDHVFAMSFPDLLTIEESACRLVLGPAGANRLGSEQLSYNLATYYLLNALEER
jgi:hypothetical protein